MEKHLEGAKCPLCGAEELFVVHIIAAEHDPSLIDLIVECKACMDKLNEFIPFSDMTVID